MKSARDIAAEPVLSGSSPSAPALSPERVGTTVGIAYGLVALASSAAAVVVPTIREDFDLSLAKGAWVITAFVVALASSAPIYGRLADKIGPRIPITVGLAVLSLGAILSALAPTIETLIAARAILGLGAGALSTLTPVIIAANLAPEDRPRALTRMSGLVAASGSGLLIGAVLAEFFGWRPALALPALGLLLLPPVRRLTPETSGSIAGIDVLGGLGVAMIAVGLNLILQLASNVLVGVIGLALIAVGVAASILGARRSAQPFIPRSVLRRAATWRVAVAASAIPATFFSLLIIIPAILTENHGISRIGIGALLFPAALIGIFVGPLAARLRERFSLRHEAGLGLALAALAMFGVSTLQAFPVGLAISFSLLSIAFGIGQAALLGILTTVTPAEEHGAALAVFMVIFFLGGGIGGTLLTILSEQISLGPSLAIMATLPALASISILTMRGTDQPA